MSYFSGFKNFVPVNPYNHTISTIHNHITAQTSPAEVLTRVTLSAEELMPVKDLAASATTISYRLTERTVDGIHLADKWVTGNSLPDTLCAVCDHLEVITSDQRWAPGLPGGTQGSALGPWLLSSILYVRGRFRDSWWSCGVQILEADIVST
ncbi:hypothetical protein Zmor_027263 [Zophobas morio]|uniref:Uncharacterized protein n=1 Tax=Zophobas morio TaxID=2755281 RepID=A0AA38M2Q3_9CUCU|nr:hypothetical protein Zmor_027263 [Zophobas morio]